MSENLATPTVFTCEADRRYWLLSKALEVVPLDRAIELARAAEAFITEAPSSGSAELSRTERAVAHIPQNLRIEEADTVLKSAAVDVAPAAMTKASARNVLPLSGEQRETVLSRMAQGAKNTDLASEFGLTPRQVQGIRMGSAREIARRREQLETKQIQAALARSESTPSAGVCMDEIIRYLRQQNDVVVPQEEGTFLVNTRFRMSAPELVARANRMRTRQGKPEFNLADPTPPVREKSGPTNGHPLFWANGSSESKPAAQTI